jgi:hypothetical protein
VAIFAGRMIEGIGSDEIEIGTSLRRPRLAGAGNHGQLKQAMVDQEGTGGND